MMDFVNNNRERMFRCISDDLVVMSKLVLRQLKCIADMVSECRVPDGDEFSHNELILDGMEVKMRKEIINAIVLYGPRAGDLRKIMACYDVTSSLERIGDLALNIYEYLSKSDMKGPIFMSQKDFVGDFLKVATDMTRNALMSFTCEDLSMAKETVDLEVKADEMYRTMNDAVALFPVDRKLSMQESVDMISLSSIAYNLERIGDNATNIAESAVYLMEGRNIQHSEFEL